MLTVLFVVLAGLTVILSKPAAASGSGGGH
jgi:hypothetical protein